MLTVINNQESESSQITWVYRVERTSPLYRILTGLPRYVRRHPFSNNVSRTSDELFHMRSEGASMYTLEPPSTVIEERLTT